MFSVGCSTVCLLTPFLPIGLLTFYSVNYLFYLFFFDGQQREIRCNLYIHLVDVKCGQVLVQNKTWCAPNSFTTVRLHDRDDALSGTGGQIHRVTFPHIPGFQWPGLSLNHIYIYIYIYIYILGVCFK